MYNETMSTLQACIRCQNCGRNIVLPPQSHLGTFGDQINPSKDIWPINFLCLKCGLVSVTPPQAIHLVELETRDQSPLVRYDFSSALSGSSGHVAIYTQECSENGHERGDIPQSESINLVLLPTRLWRDSYGPEINVSIDRGCQHKIPKT